MKRIYIAGPYSADNIMQVLKNISDGQKMAIKLLGMGFAVFCPFLDYQLAIIDPMIPKKAFQNNSMAWVDVSDALFLLPGWQESGGTLREIERANEKKIPVFEYCADLLKWGSEDVVS